MFKINPVYFFLISLICVFTFSTTPADGKTLLRWLTELGNHISNRTDTCRNSFNETAAIKPTRFSSQTIRLEKQRPNTELAEENNAQYIVNSEDEIIGIFKADSHETSPPHEVAAYELCLAIGCRIVPKTEYILFNTKTGSFQEVVEADLRNYNFIKRLIQTSVREFTRTQSSWLSLKSYIKTQEEINAMLESRNSNDTKMGVIQVFAEGTPRLQLDNHPSDLKAYMELLKDPDSTMRQDFDEMVVLDLITGSNDRNLNNYIIDINEGRLYAIDHSENFENNLMPVINWVLDAKKSQIWQTPLSYRMRQLIMGIDFSKIKYILEKYRFDSTQKRHTRQRIKKLQSIVRSNPEATLKDIVEGMGGFNRAIFLFED